MGCVGKHLIKAVALGRETQWPSGTLQGEEIPGLLSSHPPVPPAGHVQACPWGNGQYEQGWRVELGGR